MDFGVERTVGSVRSCVTVAGRVDAGTAPDLLAALLAAVDVDPRLTVDLAAVDHMDAEGLAMLLRARREAEDRGGALRLRAVPPPVRTLLDRSRPDPPFTVDPPD